MVHHAREDLAEVELAADVGRDPPERLGPVELGGRLLAQAVGVDGDAELPGDRHEEGLQLGDRGRRRLVGGHEDAPGAPPGPRDGDGDARRQAVAEREPVVAPDLRRLSLTGPGAASARPGRPGGLGGPAQAVGALAAGGDRGQAAVAPLQHDREVVAGAPVEEVDGRARDLLEAPPRGDQVGQAAQQVDLDQAALDVERRRERHGEGGDVERRASGVREPVRLERAGHVAPRQAVGRDRRPLRRARPELDDLGADRRECPHRRGPRLAGAARRRHRLLGGREEALEVAEAVAAVAPRVDAVEPEAPLVAPRPDRVGVDAQEACRLRDGERRVGRTRCELRGRLPASPAPRAGTVPGGRAMTGNGGSVRSTGRVSATSQFLPIGRRSRSSSSVAEGR